MNSKIPSLPSVFTLSLLGVLASVALAAAATSAPLFSEADGEALREAAKSGDLAKTNMLLGSTPADSTDSDGRSPLMYASAAGQFEVARALLWAGANPNLTDKAGKTAREYLKPSSEGFAPLNLLLRCYSYVKQYGNQSGKATRPNLVMVSDGFVDYTHPRLAKNYHVNRAEADGKSGEDDDKNGFVDDVYGWSTADDEPCRVPMGQIIHDPKVAPVLQRILSDYELAENGEGAAQQSALRRLKTRYDNPLVHLVGIGNLSDMNDYAFAEIFVNASHGTHVAGIVLDHSGEEAAVHALTWEHFRTAENLSSTSRLMEMGERLAGVSKTYADFIVALREEILKQSVKDAGRETAYLQTTGAGVMNMSWGEEQAFYVSVADRLQQLYASDGMNPSTMEDYSCPIGVDLCKDLAVELASASGARFALTFYDNPDTLFVVAAGNSNNNHDRDLCAPQYFSRFFPNVITVASVGDAGTISDFSNYGRVSVQVAAHGEMVYATFLAGQYGRMSGTSMAAPAVAGMAARIRSHYPTIEPRDIRLILEKTVDKHATLAEVTESGGIVNPTAAMAMADAWGPGSRSSLEVELLGRPPEPSGAHKDEGGNLELKPTEKNLTISTLGGFGSSWRVVLSKLEEGAPAQAVAGPTKEWPSDWIQKQFEKGYHVTSLGGDSGGWVLVMSKTEHASQRLVGMDFDQTTLKALMDEGFRITTMAGWDEKWVFALNTETGLGAQRYSLPSAFDDARKTWIRELWDEGYRITSVAGDSNSNAGKEDCWVVVMSMDTAYTTQSYMGPTEEWPGDWIEKKAAEGFRVTSLSGYEGRWVVVMSKGTDLGEQTISDGGSFPADWITKTWNP